MKELAEKVQAELARYEHPLFVFGARPAAEGVEVEIRYSPFSDGLHSSREAFSVKVEPASTEPQVHTYVFLLRPREIENGQFPWTLQKQLYDCLHDFIIEMFTCNPQRHDD